MSRRGTENRFAPDLERLSNSARPSTSTCCESGSRKVLPRFLESEILKNQAPPGSEAGGIEASSHSTDQFPAHTFATPEIHSWSVQAFVSGGVAATSGTITTGIP